MRRLKSTEVKVKTNCNNEDEKLTKLNTIAPDENKKVEIDDKRHNIILHENASTQDVNNQVNDVREIGLINNDTSSNDEDIESLNVTNNIDRVIETAYMRDTMKIADSGVGAVITRNTIEKVPMRETISSSAYDIETKSTQDVKNDKNNHHTLETNDMLEMNDERITLDKCNSNDESNYNINVVKTIKRTEHANESETSYDTNCDTSYDSVDSKYKRYCEKKR